MLKYSPSQPHPPTMSSRSIICPVDRNLLHEENAQTFVCPECDRRYPIREGVVCLLEQKDEFYEGAYQNHVLFRPRSESLLHTWPLWLISSGYPWLVRRHVPAGCCVVELGCAGGVEYFGQRYSMVGVDVSQKSLAHACSSYAIRLQADASRCIPLPDGSVDAVISSYFWEHMLPMVKPDILAECRRVLRPNGKLIFLYDVETNNPLIAHYKNKDLSEYNRLFLDCDGHVGYETPSENVRCFSDCGFKVLAHQGLEKTFVQSPSVYTKLETFRGASNRVFRVLAKAGSSPYFYPYTLFVRSIDSLICPFLPDSWARIAIAVASKI